MYGEMKCGEMKCDEMGVMPKKPSLRETIESEEKQVDQATEAVKRIAGFLFGAAFPNTGAEEKEAPCVELTAERTMMKLIDLNHILYELSNQLGMEV